MDDDNAIEVSEEEFDRLQRIAESETLLDLAKALNWREIFSFSFIQFAASELKHEIAHRIRVKRAGRG